MQQARYQLRGQPIGQAENGEIGRGGDRLHIRALHHRIAGQWQEGGELAPALAAAALAAKKAHL